jgi:hypothetical protein
MAGSCEDGNEASTSVKGAKFLDCLSEGLYSMELFDTEDIYASVFWVVTPFSVVI